MAVLTALRRPDAGAAARIKAWAASRFGDGAEAWLVTETTCRIPGAAPRQTVIALLHPAASIAFRLDKPVSAVTEADILHLGARAAALAAEGCC
jgi:hypothetical protein